MKRGTAEQEQKGVTMPKREASALPSPGRRLERASRTRPGFTKVWMKVTMKTTRVRSSSTFGVS